MLIFPLKANSTVTFFNHALCKSLCLQFLVPGRRFNKIRFWKVDLLFAVLLVLTFAKNIWHMSSRKSYTFISRSTFCTFRFWLLQKRFWHMNSRKFYIFIIDFSKISRSTFSQRGKWVSQQISHTPDVDERLCRLTCKVTVSFNLLIGSYHWEFWKSASLHLPQKTDVYKRSQCFHQWRKLWEIQFHTHKYNRT